jgi:L-arabinose isomerase
MPSPFDELRVGLVGIGLEAYWPQFQGLRKRLQGYLDEVAERLAGDGRSIIRLGLVDTSDAAVEAGHACRVQDIDLLFVYVTTYALSSTVLPMVMRAGVPVVLLNLQPEAAMDYDAFNRLGDRTRMTEEWLAYCNACPVPEIANVLRRLELPFFQVTGVLHGDPETWTELEEWLRAAGVVKRLAHSRLGLMGHYYSGMLDVATDLAQMSGRFGLQLEMLEVDQLSQHRLAVSANDAEARATLFDTTFDVRPDCSRDEVIRAARTSVALDRLVAEHRLDMLAYYYQGTGIAENFISENQDTMSSIILGTSALTARGIPVAGEYEVKNVIAMKMLDLLGVGGSFTEYYALDFKDDVVLMGHDGPGHPAIAQDKVKVRPLEVYHGKVGRGLSVEMSVRHGDVTLLSIAEHRERGFQLLIAEGECVPGEILKIGNTNSRYRFRMGARRFVEAWNSYGPAHHCAIGVGHIAATLRKIAGLLDLPAIEIR